MQGKLAPYLKAGAVLPTLGPPGGPLPFPAGNIATPSGKREFTQLETMKIQAACGLTNAQWDTDLPELYTRMLDEGRTTARVKALLEDVFRPDDRYSLMNVHLGVTTDMAKDVKELNFGYNNDWSYDTCHRGLSPFAVIGVSMATASKRWRHADRFTRPSNLTLAEVAQSETSPDPLPTEYHGLVNLLRRYVELLRHLVGERSGHFVEVMRITAELNSRQSIFEALKPDQVASLLWQVFMDARRFFSTGIDTRGNLPQSLLRTTWLGRYSKLRILDLPPRTSLDQGNTPRGTIKVPVRHNCGTDGSPRATPPVCPSQAWTKRIMFGLPLLWRLQEQWMPIQA
jgi:hypothetical protein